MSIQLALLKSGEEVIADIKEFRDSDEKLVSYLFSNPYALKIKTSQVLMEDTGKPKPEIVYHRWMPLSKDTDIIVDKDWIVCITDPLNELIETFTERINGGNEFGNGRDDAATGSDGRLRADGAGSVLNEQSTLSE
tara:strand:+ start:729 stop:1136 length:408 start_codon:yes stop_codon:yes gene_type:complete